MHQRLAAHIRQNLFELVDQYDAQLRAVQGHAQMSEMTRRDLEQRVLTLMAEGLEKNSDRLLIDYIHERAKQVQAHGFEPEWLQRVVTIAQDILMPLVQTLEESSFVWRAMSRAQAAAWEIVSQERQRIEATLRDSEARYQIIFDSTPIMFWLKDTQNRTLRINKAAAEFEGVNPADIEGRSAYDLYPREQAEAYYQDDLEVIRTNRPKPGIVEQHTSVGTGKLMWVETGKTPVHNEQGEVVGVLAFGVDITERKRAEEALRQNQQLLQSVMDNIPQAVFWKDQHLVYLGCNRAFAADAGLASPSDVIGQTDWEMPWQEQAELYRADDRLVMESGTPKLDYEEPQTTPDGSTIWLRTSKVPMRDAAGNVTTVLGMYEDITQRKQLEQQIQASLKQRGFQVQTSTQVAQEIAAAPALDELFRRVVTLVKERFNYYHTQIFRYEPVLDTVVLVTGYGEIGQRMLAEGHQLPMGRGVVGTAAATAQSILATDVRQDADWQPNPHLPQTRGELAVPIKWRDQMLGILDVQSDQAGALTPEDQLLLEGLCGQIASAMESTRLLERLRRSQAELSEALHIAKLAYWEYDVANDRFLFNDQFYALFHTTVEHAGGYQLSSAQYAQQFVHPDDLVIVGAEIERALNSTERHYTRLLEHRILYADGGVGYISVNVNIDRDEQGRILRYYGATQDITERKQAEEKAQNALREMERLYATVAREGWQAYRQTANLPQAYLYDRSAVQPVRTAVLPPVDEAVTQLKLVTAEIDHLPVATAPLDVRGEVVGALGVYDDPYQPLPAEDLELVKAVSEQVALALESARLFDQTQMALAETRALFRFSDLISRESGIKPIYDGVAQLLVEEIGFAGAWIAQVDTQAQVLRGIAGAGPGMGPDRNFDIVPYPHMQTPATLAARDRVMIVVNDPLHDERLSDLPDQMKVVVGKAIAVPIVIDGEIESVIMATRPVDGSDIGERDQRLLKTAAAQVAIAIQRARLFERTQRDAERERTINRITGRIRNAQSVDQVLEIAAQELSLFTHASRSVAEIRPGQHAPSPAGQGNGNKDVL